MNLGAGGRCWFGMPKPVCVVQHHLDIIWAGKGERESEAGPLLSTLSTSCPSLR